MHKFALILMGLGALNWGLVGIFQLDVVSAIFGSAAAIASRIIYTIVGLAGIWTLFALWRRADRRDAVRD